MYRFVTPKRLVISFVFLCCAVLALARFGPAGEAGSGATMLVPSITATNQDTFAPGGDLDGDGRFDPGDTILYTVTINNGGTDALNTVFQSMLDVNTTLVGGSVTASVIAGDDTYAATGNIRRAIPDGATDLLSNDVDPLTGTNAGLTAVAETKSSANCTGTCSDNVVIASDGSFTYNPPPGFEGADTFTYSLTTGGTGTVTMNVSDMIWFIDPTAGAGGDGRITNPFNTITAFNATAADEADDIIFLYSGTHSGNLTLLNTQQLIGQGVDLGTVTGITPPTGSESLPGASTNPEVDSVAGNTVTLGSGNNLRGLNLRNSAGIDLTGSSFGTLTVTAVGLTGTGRPLNLTTGNLAATFTGISTTSAAGGQGINITGATGSMTVTGGTTIAGSTTHGIFVGTTTANISFGNTSVTGGTDGISLQNNSAGTRTFGTLGLTNNGAAGFLHGAGGGTVNISGVSTITNPTGSCIDIRDSTTPVTFSNVNCTQSGGTGVNLGGTGDGNSGGVTFADLDISPDSGQRAFFADQNTGTITSTSGTISTIGNAGPFAISGPAGRTPLALVFDSITLSTATNVGLNLNLVSGNMTVGTTTITGGGGNLVGLQVLSSGAGGTMNFGNTNVSGASSTAGVRLGIAGQGNAGAITFADLDIDPNANQRAFHAVENTGTITTTSGTIPNTGTATAVEIVGTSAASRTPLNMQVTSVSATSSSSGIVLTNTSSSGSPGGFRILGTGGAGSGGSILTSTGPGVNLTSTVDVHFTHFNVQNGADDGIRGSGVTNFSLTSCNVTGNGNVVTERGVEMTNLTGTGAVTNSTFTGNAEDNFWIQNSTGTLSAFNVTGSTFSNTSTTIGNDGFHFEGSGTANMTVSITGSTFDNHRGDHFQAVSDAGNTALVQNITFNNNTLTGDRGASHGGNDLGGSITINTGGNALFHLKISGNNIQGATSSAITLNTSDTSDIEGTVSNNTIGTAGTVDSGSAQGDGINVTANNTSSITVAITGNTIRQYSNVNGIRLINRDGAAANIDATITGNTVANPGTFGGSALNARAGSAAGDGGTLCADIGGAGALANNIAAGVNPSGETDFQIRERFNTTIRIPGAAGTTTALIQAWVQGRNSPVPTGLVIDDAGGGTFSNAGTTCTQPTTTFAPPPGDDETIQTAGIFENGLNLLNSSYQSPFEWDTVSVRGPSAGSETSEPVATASVDAETEGRASIADAAPATDYWALAREVAGKLASAISPTVKAQEGRTVPNEPKVAMASGETVTVNGSGSGFTLPAAKTVTITYQAILNPVPTGQAAYTTVSNQGSVSGSNFGTVMTDDPDTGTSGDATVSDIDHTTVAVTSDTNPATFGEPVTFTATLTGVPTRASDPPGTVTFRDSGVDISGPIPVVEGAPLDNVSTAAFTTSDLTFGNHTITADYSGGGPAGLLNYNANTGTLTGDPQVIGAADTTTTIDTHLPNPSSVGQNVTVTYSVAPVAPGTGTPTGTVTVTADTLESCTASVAAGQCMLALNTVGMRTLTAVYTPDTTNYNGSMSAGVSHTVNAPSPVVYVNSAWSMVPDGMDPDGMGPATQMGFDAFATIEQGVAAVATGGMVIVYPGTYTGNVDVDREMALTGSFTTTGTLTISSADATVSPGLSPGIIASGDYTMITGSELDIEIGGTTPGTEHDQIDVAGTVSINGAVLNLSSFSGYVPPGGSFFTIINNDDTDPVVGTFSGLAEGTEIPAFLGSTLTARISYVGGDGNDVVVTVDGTTSGRVTYLTGAYPVPPMPTPTKPVPDVTVTAFDGFSTIADITDANGDYSLTGFGMGSYTITPSKTPYAVNSFNGIFSNDATIISQHVVGLITLNDDQLKAARVSGLPNVSSFEAALIAQYLVGIPNPINKSGQWVFTPESTMPDTTLNNVQDYQATLFGDVNGDWDPMGARPAEPLTDPERISRAAHVSTGSHRAVSGTEIVIPLKIENLRGAGVTSYQFDIEYDPAVLSPAQVIADLTGTIGEGLSIVYNSPEEGLIKVVAYGAFPVMGDGTYVNLKFQVNGKPGTTSSLVITAFRFNDGRADVLTTDGEVRVVGFNTSRSVRMEN